jgi:hydrogenase maturation protease
MNRPILVAACGNTLAGDDAFGPLVAARLRTMALPGVEVLDLGMKPAGLVCSLSGRAAVVIVDAAAPGAGLPPGKLIELDFFDPRRPRLCHDSRLSSHSLSFAHELELARSLGVLPPRIILIAAPASTIAIGAPTSADTEELVGLAARRVAELAEQWLAASREMRGE